MKNFRLYLFLLLIGCGSFSSCIELDPKDYSEINPSNFPKTEEDLRALVLSCYNPLRSDWWNGIHTTSERGVMFILDATTEILTQTWGPAHACSQLNFFPETSDVTWFYYTRNEPNGYANKISRCTMTLDQIEKSDVPDRLKQQYGAEVRCARAMLSYILFDMYGPLVVAPLDMLVNPLKEKALPRLSHEEMVRFIEEDLLYAAEHLPMPANTEYGKFSKGLANMLLIRLYLHETVKDKSLYNQVEKLARELMKPDYGYQLADSYPKMFELGGQGSGNKEIIWAIPCSYEGPNYNQWHLMALPTNFKQNGMNPGWGSINSTWWFYDTFEADDERKTYLLAEYTDVTGETVTRNTPSSPIALGPIPMKYGYDPEVSASGGFTAIDIILYRYADVLLSLAEALVKKPDANGSSLNEALGYMNQVRNRSGLRNLTLQEVDTPEKFINKLLTERSHEFWCENGQYRADLIRHDKFVERAVEVSQTPFASKYKELFPLPLSVINDGKGEVKQNPGYGM